jgi:hypothetical protein
MTIHSIGRARESLNWTSESYKEAIREYLDTDGYSQISDSFVEGDLADMVFINPSLAVGEKTLVESKASSISALDEDLGHEIIEYLTEWLRLDQNEKFRFFIFAKSISKKSEFQRIFGSKCNSKSVEAYVNRFKAKTDEDSSDLIESSDAKEIFRFFRRIEIWEASGEVLKLAANEKRKRSRLSLEGYARSLVTDVNRRTLPFQEKTVLVSNLAEFSPPKRYFGLQAKYSVNKDIYSYYERRNLTIPPFLIGKDGAIYTFQDLTAKNDFEEIAISNPFEISVGDTENVKFVVWLLNQHLRRLV